MLHLRKRDRAAIERIETSLCAEAVVRSKRDGHARVKRDHFHQIRRRRG
jgi:hypothetical protein